METQHKKKGLSCPTWRLSPSWYKIFQIGNIISFILHFIVGCLSSARVQIGGVAGATNEAIGFTLYYNALTPAKMTFYVWCIIWVFMILFCIYQMLPVHRVRNGFLQRINFAFMVANLATATQLIVFPLNGIIACIVIMVINSAAVVYIWIQLNFRDKPAFATKANSDLKPAGWLNFELSGRTERILFFWFVQLPMTAYGVMVGASTTVMLGYSFTWGTRQTFSIEMQNWAVAWLVILACIVIFSTSWALDWPFAAIATWIYACMAREQAGLYRVWVTSWVLATIIAATGASAIVVRTLRFFHNAPRVDRYPSDDEEATFEMEKKGHDAESGVADKPVSDLLGPRKF